MIVQLAFLTTDLPFSPHPLTLDSVASAPKSYNYRGMHYHTRLQILFLDIKPFLQYFKSFLPV